MPAKNLPCLGNRNMLTVRASSCGRIMACPASALGTELRIGSSAGPADVGTGVHDILRAVVSGESYNIAATSQVMGVDPDELEKLVKWCRWRWTYGNPEQDQRPLRDFFPDARTEQRFTHVNEDDGLTLTGQLDLNTIVEIEGRIGDYKTGYLDTPADDQMKAYGFLLLKEFPDIDCVRVAVVRPRFRAVDWDLYTRETLEQWYARLLSKVKQGSLYNPGPNQCRYCERGHSCPAKEAELRQATILLESSFDKLPDDPEERGQILAAVETRAKFLGGFIDKVRDRIKTEVRIAGGELGPLSISNAPRTNIEPGKGLPVLRQYLSEDEVHSLLTVGKTKTEKAIKATAGRGMKEKVWAGVMQELEDADALFQTDFETLKIDTTKLRSVPRLEETSV